MSGSLADSRLDLVELFSEINVAREPEPHRHLPEFTHYDFRQFPPAIKRVALAEKFMKCMVMRTSATIDEDLRGAYDHDLIDNVGPEMTKWFGKDALTKAPRIFQNYIHLNFAVLEQMYDQKRRAVLKDPTPENRLDFYLYIVATRMRRAHDWEEIQEQYLLEGQAVS